PIVMRVPAEAGFSPLYDGSLATGTFRVHDVRGPFRVDFFSMTLGYNARLGPGGHAIELGAGTTIPVVPNAVEGRVDSSAAENGSVHFIGWAASLARARPAEEVDVFSHGTLVYSSAPSGD